MAKFTFRTQALEKLSSPEQLDQAVRVTTLKSWLALAGLVFLLFPLAGWSLFGSLENRITAQGLLLPVGGVCVVSAPTDGQVIEAGPAVGDEIHAGQTVARVQGVDTIVTVNTTCAGKVVSVLARVGDPVRQAAPLLIVEPAGQALEVAAYLPLETARMVKPGMAAQISPAAIQKEVYGYLLGTVTAVEQYPITAERLALQTGSQSLAQSFLDGGALVELRIALSMANDQPQWSLRRADVPSLLSSTPCTVYIVVDRSTPVELIFPSFQR